MKTLEQATKYTLKKKDFQISKSLDSNFEEPIEELKGYLNNDESKSSVSLNFNYLSSWYLWRFVYSFLKDKELNYNLLAASTYSGIEANNWKFTLGTISPSYDSAVPLEESVMQLGQLLYLGWYDQAIVYGKLLLKMLYGKQYDGGITIGAYPWFIIELFCKWQNIELDKTRLRYPENLGVYKKALDNIDTSDALKLADIINELSTYHIKNSDENVATDKYDNEYGSEFSDSSYFIFPVEILTWLAIRRNLGLPEFIADNNELMRMQINSLPEDSIDYSHDELISKCKAKLLADNPGIKFEF